MQAVNFTYVSSYGVSNRIVSLQGEGFFKITTNKHKPFIVKTPYADVKAMGTTFNVKAYPGINILLLRW